MERMLVVVFDDESKADEGKNAIVQLDREGSMVVYGCAVDRRMEAIGGTVFRRALSAVSDTVDAEEIAAMKADLAQVHADRKATLHGRRPLVVNLCNHCDPVWREDLCDVGDEIVANAAIRHRIRRGRRACGRRRS